jgi:hypothetical protein
MKKQVLLLAFTLLFAFTTPLFSAVPWATGKSQPKHLTISLVTFGPGDDIQSWWGHTGLIVEDKAYKISRVYNYGLYALGGDMLKNFATGRLIFSTGAFRVEPYFKFYKKYNRDIRILPLVLSDSSKIWLSAKLAEDVLPENRNYLYHHYYNNCATKLRDLLNTATDSLLYKETRSASQSTLREHTVRYTTPNFPMELLLMFLMNDSIDKPGTQWGDMFLPDELEKHMTQLNNIQLSLNDTTENEFKKHIAAEPAYIFKAKRSRPPLEAPQNWHLSLIGGFFLVLIAWVLTQWAKLNNSIWLRGFLRSYLLLIALIIAIPGTGLAYMASFTDHTVTYYNINLLLANPFSLSLIYTALRFSLHNTKILKLNNTIWLFHYGLTLLLSLAKLLGLYEQNNWLIIAFTFPLYGGMWLITRPSYIQKR